MPALDPQLRTLLTSLRRRVRRYIVADSLLALVVVVLSAFWLGLLVDFVPVRLGGTEMPRLARTLLLLVVGVGVLVLLAKLLVGRLRRPLPDDSLALLVERHHPQLGGRLVTAVQLQRDGRSGDSHAPAMLRRVHAEAAEAVGGVDSSRIFRWQPLIQKAWLVLPLAVATILFAALSPSAFGRAAGRLLLLSDAPWPRQASLEMVGVELPVVSVQDSDLPPPVLIRFENGSLRLPRGSSGTLRVRARAQDAVVPEVCTVYFVSDDGTRGQANMRRVGRVIDGYQAFLLEGPPLAGLSESVTLSVRGLDARLDNFRIEAVQPPALTRVQVVTTDPDYLQPPIRQNADMPEPVSISRRVDYQSGLRVREGAKTELVARSSVPLGRVDARMLVGNTSVASPAVSLSANATEFTLSIDDLRQPVTIIIVPEDRDGISAQVPYRYFLGVVMDEKPEIEMRLKGIGTAVTRNARIPIFGKATDDYELDFAAVTLSTVDQSDRAAATTDEAGEPVESDAAQPSRAIKVPIRPDRDGDFQLTIDLREIGELTDSAIAIPEPGGAINLLGEVTDHYDLDGRNHRSASQLYRLDILTPENLLALLERRELGLRSRLEQTIEETRSMRDAISALTPDLESLEPLDVDIAEGAARTEEAADGPARERQVLRLRTQQIGLQATKTSEELEGIAISLDDLLEEMANNRVDSVDRSERIGSGVRDPLRGIVAGDLATLREQIAMVERRTGAAAQSPSAPELSAQAVQTAEQVLLQLTAVLEKMLDLESYNEILDMVRELIDSQEGLIEETKKEQRRRVLDLFE